MLHIRQAMQLNQLLRASQLLNQAILKPPADLKAAVRVQKGSIRQTGVLWAQTIISLSLSNMLPSGTSAHKGALHPESAAQEFSCKAKL